MKYLLILLIAFSACTQGKRNEQFQQGLQFSDDFSGTLTNPPWRWDVGDGTVELVTDPTDAGNKVIKMRLDRKLYSSPSARSQMEFKGSSADNISAIEGCFETWGRSYRMYIPSDFKSDPTAELIMQIFSNVGGGYHIGLSMYFDPNFEIRVKHIYNTVNDPTDPSQRVETNVNNIATVSPGHWHYFVYNTHWDYRAGNTNGYHKIYMKLDEPPDESDLIFTYIGPTGINDVNCGVRRMSMYKFNWGKQQNVDASEAAGIDDREWYFDDFLVQDSDIDLSGVPPVPCETDTIYIEVPADTIYLQPKIYVASDSTLYEIETIQ